MNKYIEESLCNDGNVSVCGDESKYTVKIECLKEVKENMVTKWINLVEDYDADVSINISGKEATIEYIKKRKCPWFFSIY